MNAVITYIYGHNELLRDPLFIDDNTEYICITDNPGLKSNRFRIIYDPRLTIKSNRDKMAYTKFSPFEYTTAENIVIMDGSCQITKSLIPLVDMLNNYSIVCKRHPVRTNLYDELFKWHAERHLSFDVINKFYAMASQDHVDIHQSLLIEGNIFAIHRCDLTIQLMRNVLLFMRWLGTGGKLVDTNQCVLTYLLIKYNIEPGWLTQSNFILRYIHNTWTINPT